MLQPRTAEGPTLADALVPSSSLALDAALVVAMTALIALCARIVIPLPWTPVPITGSTLGVLYAGALLGPRRGPAAVALYLGLGAAGLPVFAPGVAGWATAGYLIGFLPGAWVTGALARRGWDRGSWTAFAAMLLGSAPIFACGLAVLRFYVPHGQVLAKGLYPFIVGDLAKACLSAGLLPLGWRLVGRRY